MTFVLPAVACGWLLGLVLVGVLATDLTALAALRNAPPLSRLWGESLTRGMVTLAAAAVLLLGTAIGLAVSAIYAVELFLLGGERGAALFLLHAGVFLIGAALLAALCYRHRGRRRYAVVIGTASGILFGIVFPLLAA